METLVDRRYLPLQERGRGAVASVWRSYDRLSEREVALKIPLPRAGPRGRREILVESLALSRLDHPGIVRLLAVESAFAGPLPRGAPYLVLEHLPGGPAGYGALAGSPVHLAAVARQGLEALQHLHAARLVHRDLKPDNVLLEFSPHGPRVTLIDLGSSTPEGRGRGRYAGSAAWAAPEALLGGGTGARSDLYSLGRVLHHLSGGRPPFEADDPFGVSRWLLRPERLRPAAGLPPEIAGLIGGLTRPRPGERPVSAAAALRELAGGRASPPARLPLRTPRGFLRSLQRGLQRAQAGETVFLERRVAGERARETLLSRAATEGIRAGFAPLRPAGRGGLPLAPGDLARLLLTRATRTPERYWRGAPTRPEGAKGIRLALEEARRASGRPLLLLLDGAAWAPGELRVLRGPLLLLILSSPAAARARL